SAVRQLRLLFSFFHCSRDHPYLHSFPTRRSSDLNGARLERINFLGDRSKRAMRQAYGLMVNYLYKLDDIEANHEAFAGRGEVVRSEEHTSELQSRENLVCRLLLEKKKKNKIQM